MRLTDLQLSNIIHCVPGGDGTQVVVVENYGQDDLANEQYCNNVYRTKLNGDILWQIDAPEGVHGRDAFTYVKFVNGQTIGKRGSGCRYVVDLNTGVARAIGFEK